MDTKQQNREKGTIFLWHTVNFAGIVRSTSPAKVVWEVGILTLCVGVCVMASTVRRLLACLVIGAFACTIGTSVAQEKKKGDKKEGKTPTIKEIMKKVPGKSGLCAQCKTAGDAEKWEDAAKIATELKTLGEALGKNTPKKGDKGDWDKQAKTFSENMTAIAEATEKKDKKALEAAVKKFGGSCKNCHDAHK
jgi:cytochrome c556